MKYKHTPGPWTAFQDYPRRHTVGTATGRICDMWGQDPAFYTDEDEANARLIASAPDLLAIVQFIAREHRDGAQEVYFGALFNDKGDDITTLGDAVTTAIAKATGREEVGVCGGCGTDGEYSPDEFWVCVECQWDDEHDEQLCRPPCSLCREQCKPLIP